MSFPLKRIVITSCFSVVAAGGYEFYEELSFLPEAWWWDT